MFGTCFETYTQSFRVQVSRNQHQLTSLMQYLEALLGNGKSARYLEGLRSQSNQDVVALFGSDVDELAHLSKAIDAVFNADRRAFSANFVSYLPVTSQFVGQDPSDDGYGRNLVESWDQVKQRELAPHLRRLLDGELSADPMTQLARILDKVFVEFDPQNRSSVPEVTHSVNSAFAESFFPVVRDSLTALWEDQGSYGRVPALQSFSTLVSALLAIGLLFDPALRHATSDTSSTDFTLGDVIGVVVFTGKPPGFARDPLVRLAQLSLRDYVKRSHDGVRMALLEKFQCDETIAELSRDQIETVVLESTIPRTKVAEFVSTLDALRDDELGSDFLDELISFEELRSSLNSLGRKVGFVAPQRGPGESRLVLETPLLDSIVRTLGQEGSSLDEFVNTCYKRTGLIIGQPSNLSVFARKRLEDIAGRSIDVDESLSRAHQQLDERLVRSGLAQKFSDGVTILSHK